jgi:hypothetical protein
MRGNYRLGMDEIVAINLGRFPTVERLRFAWRFGLGHARSIDQKGMGDQDYYSQAEILSASIRVHKRLKVSWGVHPIHFSASTGYSFQNICPFNSTKKTAARFSS